MKFDPKLRSFI
jgi:hypothetical protein